MNSCLTCKNRHLACQNVETCEVYRKMKLDIEKAKKAEAKECIVIKTLRRLKTRRVIRDE